MEKFKGTPGPWKMNGRSKSGAEHFNVVGTKLGEKYKIATVPFIGAPFFVTADYEEAEANAALIAAAPDLLEACEAFIELFRESDMRPEDECHELYEKIKAAITKATTINQP